MPMLTEIRTAGLLLCWGVFCSLPLAAGPVAAVPSSQLGSLPYVRTVRMLKPEEDASLTWGKIPLDPLLYEHTADLQSDFLLTGPDGSGIPFVVERETAPGTVAREFPVPGEITGITRLPDGSTAIEYTLENAAEICGVEFVHPNSPFRRALSVKVSLDGQWVAALPNCILTDCPGFPEPVRRQLRFPRSFRTGKIQIVLGQNLDCKERHGAAADDVQDLSAPAAIELEAIHAVAREFHPSVKLPVLQEYTLTRLSRTWTDGRDVTILGSRREPLTAIRVVYPEPRYQRRAEIAGSDDGRNWVPLTGATLRKLDSELLDAIELPGSRYRRYKLTVISDDGPHPAVQPVITAVGFRHFLAVRAPFADSMNLYYGGKGKMPDPAAVVPPPQNVPPVLFTLGNAMPNPAAAPVPKRLPVLLPLLVPAALLLLLLGIRKILQRTPERIPDDPE